MRKKLILLHQKRRSIVMSKREIDGLMACLYYEDVERTTKFYTEIMGFKTIRDQGWFKILKINEGKFMCLVDGKKGFHKASPAKPVMITFMVNDVDAWHRHLKKHGVELLGEPNDYQDLGIRMFMLKDPEGYVLEIEKFL